MSKSAIETLTRHIGEHGIPMPISEHQFHSRRKWRFDFAWPEHKLAFEVEGGAFINGRHTRPKGFIDDIEKYNSAGLDGWLVLRATTQQVKSGKAIQWLIDFFSGAGNE